MNRASGSCGVNVPTSGVGQDGANGVTLIGVIGPAQTDWTTQSIALAPKGGWVLEEIGGVVATRADIRGVLADVDQILIRGEYVRGNETGGLDNVVLSTPRVDPPAAHDLVAAGAFGPDFDLRLTGDAHAAPLEMHHVMLV